LPSFVWLVIFFDRMASRSKPDVFTQLRLLETEGARAVKAITLEDNEEDAVVRLNPAQRKIKAARLQHERAVKALLARNENAREMALAGVEALDQAQSHDAATDEARLKAEVKPSVATVSELASESEGLAKAYKQAMLIEENAAEGKEGDAERLKAWQLVFAVAATLIEKHGASPSADVEKAYRAPQEKQYCSNSAEPVPVS
jgi:hypothetical protein